MRKLNFPLVLLISTVLGAIVGYIVGEPIKVIKPLGELFYRLLFMVVPALVFFSIASSFANTADLRKMSRWASKVIGWFLLTTLIGTIIGIVCGLIWKPGLGLPLKGEAPQITQVSLSKAFLEWIPKNWVGALAEGNIIQIVIFAIIAGIAIALMEKQKEKQFLQDFLNAGFGLMVTIVKYVLYYAPIGVFALMATSIAEFKGALIREMARFLTAYTVAFVLHVVIVYFILFWAVTRLNPLRFIKKVAAALITAFTTCSSAGTMPVTLRVTRELGVPEELVNFGIPLGVTFNMDSMAIEIPLYIMLGMYATGLNPSFVQLIQFVLLGIVFSIGCAGVPGGGIAIAAILVNLYNLPPEVVAWIAAVFVYLDVTGTMMNVWGDMVCTTTVAKTEGVLDLQKFNS